ncbi:hypothetical protein NTCA1_54820 [Novosphingobium sp. TCA1]|nr:hypothetical protein NTCA1_54820 [Novosphingobium sp. TCA1]
MVVAYARPFSSARGKAAPFSWKLLGAGFTLEPSERALHSRLIDSRNRLHAHSDDEHSDITGEILRSDLGDGRSFDFLSVFGGEWLFFDGGEVEAIHTFLWKVRSHVDKAVQNHPAPRDAFPVRKIDLS